MESNKIAQSTSYFFVCDRSVIFAPLFEIIFKQTNLFLLKIICSERQKMTQKNIAKDTEK